MKLQLVVRTCVAATLLAGGLPAMAGNQAHKIPEPILRSEPLREDTFGDDQNVAMLAELLLAERDPISRVLAVTDLGQTHNAVAMPYLRKAFADDQLPVRIAAVAAAGEIGLDQAHKMVIQALAADQSEMLLAAMRAVRRLGLSAAAGPVGKLLSSGDPLVRATALKTLAALGASVEQSTLSGLLWDSSTRVRLEALASVLMMKKTGRLSDALLGAAGQGNPPAVRSRAIAALGKHAASRGRAIMSAAADSSDPLIRRGAVRAYHNAGQRDRIAPFLDDGSAMVRLAAIQAAGDLRLATSADRLMVLMLDAPDGQSHRAARQALAQIATTAIAKATEKALVRWHETAPPRPPKPTTKPAAQNASRRPTPPPAPKGPTAGRISRNVASCCWLLGKLKDSRALEYQLAMMPKLSTESSILLELVPALAEIGDQQAVGPLAILLDRCKKKGTKYLRALASGSPPPPYEPEIPRRIIQALAELKAYDRVDDILGVARVNVRGMRLNVCASYAVRVLPDLLRDDNRSKIEEFIAAAIADESFLLTPRFYAAKAAARMKTPAAIASLEKVLNRERPGKVMMRAAAWAIQAITGKTPAIPQPRTRQGKWVVTKMRE